MPTDLVARLESWKTRFGENAAELSRLLQQARSTRLTDPESLIHMHECLLFLRAFPPDAEVMGLTEGLLFAFAERLDAVRQAGGDLTAFENPRVSGIAGTSFSAVFSYEVARQLLTRHSRDLEIDWANYDASDKLGPVLRRCLPLVEEDWPVEAHVPFRDWIAAVRARGRSDLGWLIERFAALPLNPRERADLYESLDLLLEWRIGDTHVSRSKARVRVRQPYFHTEPLLRRADILLGRELELDPLPIRRLAPSEARRLLALILDTSATRYRELYGFTHPDAKCVYTADAGRGLEVVFFGIPPEWRLPLRAYHAGMFFKNGVPAGYVEALSLFERAEVGFNLYYTFREGESAWIYARLLRLFRQVLGVRCFSVDPYQLGWLNDEAVDSGAFWFYRKLGFRPVDPKVARLTAREEDRIRKQPGYRSPRRILEKLAEGYALYECAGCDSGVWDRFSVRRLAQALQRRMNRVAAGAGPGDYWKLIEGVDGWSKTERAEVDEIIKAKISGDEARSLHLMQGHARLRAAAIRLGSRELE